MTVEFCSAAKDEGKPLKCPLVCQVCDVVLINKIDTREYFPFEDEAVVKRIKALNPNAEIFFISAKTGEGFDAWTDWLRNALESYTGKPSGRNHIQ